MCSMICDHSVSLQPAVMKHVEMRVRRTMTEIPRTSAASISETPAVAPRRMTTLLFCESL